MKQYIDKSVLVAEIERRIKECGKLANAAADNNLSNTLQANELLIRQYTSLLHFLNTFKVKEVDLEEAAIEYCSGNRGSDARVRAGFLAGANWQKENLWKPADGPDLPEIDREVIVLYQPYPLENSEYYAVGFGHRPREYWDGKNISTGEVTRYYPKKYDKGGWNSPNIKWWLDLELPINEEE